MIANLLPKLDAPRCHGCGDCVVVCPVQCLETVDDEPVLARPDDCVLCGLCVQVCPWDALTMGRDETTPGPG